MIDVPHTQIILWCWKYNISCTATFTVENPHYANKTCELVCSARNFYYKRDKVWSVHVIWDLAWNYKWHANIHDFQITFKNKFCQRERGKLHALIPDGSYVRYNERRRLWLTLPLQYTNILWHVYTLLGNACNTQAANNTGAVFSLCSRLRHTTVLSNYVVCVYCRSIQRANGLAG
jgi:hypothetical protein